MILHIIDPPQSTIIDDYREQRILQTYPRIPEDSRQLHRYVRDESINPFDKFNRGMGLNWSERSNFSGICKRDTLQLISCYRDCDDDFIPETFRALCRYCPYYVDKKPYDTYMDTSIWLPYLIIRYMETNRLFPESSRSKWCVYFITDGAYVKIGLTNNLKSRINGIQTGNPNEIKVLFTIPTRNEQAAREVESKLHFIYSDYRMSGEWFNILKELNTNKWLDEMSKKEAI